MSRFLSPLIIEELDCIEILAGNLAPDRDWFRLAQPLRYESELIADLYWLAHTHPDGVLCVPAGEVTDFASVPRLFWGIVPPNDSHYTRAAVLHDWLYSQREFPKELCDRIFREAMQALGLSRVKTWLMYQAVHWFGGRAYAGK